jgi:hypothetical protein
MIKPAQIPAKIIEAILLTKTNLETSFSIEDPKCLTSPRFQTTVSYVQLRFKRLFEAIG